MQTPSGGTDSTAERELPCGEPGGEREEREGGREGGGEGERGCVRKRSERELGAEDETGAGNSNRSAIE